eukprot:CAMPEP_0181302966 /NCGR_PEP_ID=MMETSP1101-20121128/8291_1 /TAXON_ID=46948 /ORGANISM="Rhodomonas abbreviata, Strain Caron Lab Isolate" /LENGTH=51 /DNA_ID=CAMNT_0023408477 /DNA_START=861 /DNA_END=1012 /DNA_ORIENTATION=-
MAHHPIHLCRAGTREGHACRTAEEVPPHLTGEFSSSPRPLEAGEKGQGGGA